MSSALRVLGRVLVTGAQGFVGEALVNRLRTLGYSVAASDRTTATHACDLTDFAQVDALVRGGYDTIFHCGAVSGPMVMADQPLEIWRINALGTAHVLEAARLYDAGRVVVCSTSEVYGAANGTVDETTLPQPANVYAASKLAAEAATFGYVREHGLDAVVLRLSWIYGPGRRTPTTLETVLRAVSAGQAAQFDAGPDEITHYLYIDDAVSGLLCAARTATLPERLYNISAGPGVPLRSLATIVTRLRPGARVTFGDSGGPDGGPAGIDNRRAADHLAFRPVLTLDTGLAAYLRALSK